MTLSAELRIMRGVEIVEYLRIRSARLAERHGVGCSCATPPIFLRIVIKNTSILHTETVTILTGADDHLLRIDTFLREQFFPDYGGFGISRDVVFLVADKRGHIETVGIESELIRKKFKKPRELFFFEVVAKRPVAEHLEKGCVPVVAHLFDVFCPK